MKKTLLLLVALITATIAFAQTKIDGIYYYLNNSNQTAEVTNGDYYSGDIIIPEKVTYNSTEYSVTSIGYSAFTRCSSLTSITIPNSVTSIGNYAFSDCTRLTSITIPNSVTSIGYCAFYGTPWLENQPDGCLYIGRCLYEYKGEMPANTHIDVKEGTTMICGSAFSDCSSLTSITIPNSVTSIGDYAFERCSSLTSITIPNSVTSIGKGAFEDCSNLRTIKLGNSIESIEKDAFKGCTALYSFEISTEIPPIIDATTFAEVSSTLQIKVPCNAVEDYKASNHWNSFSNFKANPYTLTVNTNNNTMGEAFVIKQPNCQDITAHILAQALPEYEFVKWSNGFTENPYTIYVTRDTTITAEFRKIKDKPENKHNIFIVESANKTQGDVTITITANAIKGFEFSHWSDGSTENPRNVTLESNIELYAYFKVADATNVETSKISSANIYTTNGTLHIEGATDDYHILDAAGRLIYSGNATTLTLPRGIYLITMGGEVEKIVL